MTIKELITKLSEFPPEMRVVVDGYEDDFDDPIVHEAWAVIDNSERKDDDDWWLGKHEDVSRYDEKRRQERGAEFVIVIAR